MKTASFENNFLQCRLVFGILCLRKKISDGIPRNDSSTRHPIKYNGLPAYLNGINGRVRLNRSSESLLLNNMTGVKYNDMLIQN